MEQASLLDDADARKAFIEGYVRDFLTPPETLQRRINERMSIEEYQRKIASGELPSPPTEDGL
jgi:hypothetical protein